jgi:Cu+-exporting ATPase
MAKDFVCGMQVKEAEAAGSSLYKGQKYYFCSSQCKQRFDEDPEKYIKTETDLEIENKMSESAPVEKESPVPLKEPEAQLERIDLPIVGMSCASCASTIQRGLIGLQGVEKANVNFATSKATLFFQPQLTTMK